MNKQLIVETRAGKVRGAKQCNFEGDKYYAFIGIPYAKPPVGELRFQDPEPLEPWTGVREATSYGPNCAQIDFITHEVIGSDDCLYLNVYARSIDADKPRAVMVWIHGGGFIIGFGDDSVYGPDFFMRKDVVLVTINYRLGALGFLNLDDESASGNQGLKDQVMALRWVQQNIANFGGDPGNVTIFGESAGGASVHYLTLSPLAKGLFHKAIAQSGVAINPWAFHPDPKERAYQLCERLGHTRKDPTSALEFLRAIDIQKLIKAQEKLPTKDERIQLEYCFGPSIDSKAKHPFMPIHPEEAAKQGVQVPLIIGQNNREGIILLRELRRAHKRYNKECDRLLHPNAVDTMKKLYGLIPDDLKRIYFKNDEINDENVDKLIDMFGDLKFVEGIHRVIQTQVEKSSAPTYFYEFTYDKDPSFIKIVLNTKISGAAHGDEVFYLFPLKSLNTLKYQFNLPKKNLYQKAKWLVMMTPIVYLVKCSTFGFPRKGSDKYRKVEQMTEMWVNFAKTGKPTIESSDVTLDWLPVDDTKNFRCLNISEVLHMEVAQSLANKYSTREEPDN